LLNGELPLKAGVRVQCKGYSDFQNKKNGILKSKKRLLPNDFRAPCFQGFSCPLTLPVNRCTITGVKGRVRRGANCVVNFCIQKYATRFSLCTLCASLADTECQLGQAVRDLPPPYFPPYIRLMASTSTATSTSFLLPYTLTHSISASATPFIATDLIII